MGFVYGTLIFSVAALVASVVGRKLGLFSISASVIVVLVGFLWLDHKHGWSDQDW